MQSDYAQPLSQETWMNLAEEPSPPARSTAAADVPNESVLTYFQNHFVGSMELAADAHTVAEYLKVHQGWFCRCAHPMKVEPLGENGYLLRIGRYGSFGFEIEPKIGLHLLPPDDQGIYRIETIHGAVTDDQGYQVDFRAALQLVERAEPSQTAGQTTTHVEWTLDLGVSLSFPRFIRRLPHALIQKTGDRLLAQIVRQVSRRLTAKVQDDFHASQKA